MAGAAAGEKQQRCRPNAMLRPPAGFLPLARPQKAAATAAACCRGQGYHGLMDEVRLWRVARSQADILAHMRDSTGLGSHQVRGGCAGLLSVKRAAVLLELFGTAVLPPLVEASSFGPCNRPCSCTSPSGAELPWRRLPLLIHTLERLQPLRAGCRNRHNPCCRTWPPTGSSTIPS